MKLRLVREDGAPATIEDLSAWQTRIVIDGVTTAITSATTPDLQRSDRGGPNGEIRLTLWYVNEARIAGRVDDRWGWRGGREDVSYSCPFFWRAWERIVERNSIESRRRRERLEYRP